MNASGIPAHSTAAKWLAIVSVFTGLAVAVPSAFSGTASSRGVLLTVAVSGKGTVTSTPRGISCRSKCHRRFPARAMVRLTAKPSKEWSLWKWSGPCLRRKGADCTVRMTAARSVKPVFRRTIELTPPPHRPRAPSADAQKLLAYLTRLSNDTEPGVIVGQTCRDSGLICDDTRFQEAVGALHDQSGKWPGIINVDYDGPHMFSPSELSRAGQERIIPYAQAGGLVQITWFAVNPWAPDPQAPWPAINVKYPGSSLRALLPGGSKRLYWLHSLDRIATALAELRDAGVVVLWRPMQEMNGDWYWWARYEHKAYASLWRDMFDYFTSVKGLNNLLWVYAPVGDQTAFPLSSYPYADAYPGADYVDLIAPTLFRNDLAFGGYGEALKYGKPIALSEYGPDASTSPDSEANGSFDDRKYIERLAGDYPRVAYFVAWDAWEGVKLSLADNLFASELMNDPRVITRDKIAWR